MRCPYCGYEDSRVIDSREMDDTVRRRRQCLGCELRFTTHEKVETSTLMVIKKDSRREEFQRDKLVAGLRKACTKRPVSYEALERLADDVEAELHRLGRAEVPSSAIGEMVMERLKRLDHIAYIRFASVYRQFADIGSLKQEVDTLLQEGRQARDGQLPLIPLEPRAAPLRRGRRK